MKKLMSAFLILVVCFVLIPVKSNAATKKIVLKDASIEYSILISEKLYLQVKTTKNATWTSSNKKVATVSKKGIVLGKKAGKAIITAKVGKSRHKCTVYVLDGKALKNASEKYNNKIDRDLLDPDIKIEFENVDKSKEKSNKEKTGQQVKDMLKYGFASSEDMKTELGQAYIKFCQEWISTHELKSVYKITADVAPDTSIYLCTVDFKTYRIYGTPKTYDNDKVYTNGSIRYRYLDKFTHNGESFEVNQLYFNRADLIKKGIIK